MTAAGNDLLADLGGQKVQTILAAPPWQFQNRTGKMAPEHKRLARGPRPGWTVWGNQAEDYTPTWDTYSNHSQSKVLPLRARQG